MSVDTYALTTLADAKAYLSEIDRNAFWIYYSGSATTATVQVSNDTLILIHDSNTDASLDLTHASYDTIGEVVAYINASVSNWEAGRLCHSSVSSDGLLETGQLNALGTTNRQTLKAEDDYLVEKLINGASDLIERYCNRKIKSRDYTREIYYGSGYTELILDQYPVTRVFRLSSGRTNAFSIKNSSTDINFCTVEVTSTTIRLIVDGGSNEDDTALTLSEYSSIDALITAIEALDKGWSCTALVSDSDTRDASEILIRPAMYCDNTTYVYIEIPNDEITDYKIQKPSTDRNEGILEKPSVFNEDTEYFVSYTAGYSTTPYDLELVCLELVKWRWLQIESDTSMKSEKKGDYSYTRFGVADLEMGLSPELKARIDYYKKRVI